MFLRVLIFIILIFLVYRIITSMRRARLSKNESERVIPPQPSAEDLVEDPVCRKNVPVSQAYKKEISGRIYYFCSKHCCDKYMSSEDR